MDGAKAMTRAGTVILLTLALLIAVPGAALTRVMYRRWADCQEQERRTHVATSWTPWDGCTAVVLGTRIKVGD
jgi:hypothetical protein